VHPYSAAAVHCKKKQKMQKEIGTILRNRKTRSRRRLRYSQHIQEAWNSSITNSKAKSWYDLGNHMASELLKIGTTCHGMTMQVAKPELQIGCT